MNKNDIVTILAGGVLAFVAWKILSPSVGGASAGGLASWVSKINVGNTAGTEAAGWQYFTNGTAIAPNGDYYYQGSLVYKAQP